MSRQRANPSHRNEPYNSKNVPSDMAIAYRNGRPRLKTNRYQNSIVKCHRNSLGTSQLRSVSDPDTAITYYDYFDGPGAAQQRPEGSFYSEESGSTRLPLYDESEDDLMSNKFAKHNLGYCDKTRRSVRSQRERHSMRASTRNSRDFRRIYANPTDEEASVGWDRLYQEIPNDVPSNVVTNLPNRRVIPISRVSDQAQSSMSSRLGSPVIDGCGGKCQTCENICYFFLQLAFTMGVLIGISLCVAGAVLRRSAAKNLQVLVYIGVLVAAVSAVLLAVQCDARIRATRRKRLLWANKRQPVIPLNVLNSQPMFQAQVVVQNETGPASSRLVPMPQVPIQGMSSHRTSPESDLQGIPWWRRRELN